MNTELAAYLLTYSLLIIPIVFAIGLLKQSINEESVHTEDYTSKVEHDLDDHHDKAA
jgi:hypothetical protein